MFADVLVEYPVKSLDKAFTYEVPKKDIGIIKIGMKVLVPFNKRNINGIILRLHNNKPEYNTLSIISILNKDFYLNDEQIKIAYYLSESTLCPLITAFQAMLPPALKIDKNKDYKLYDIYVYLNKDDIVNKYILEHKTAYKQIELIKSIGDKKVLKSSLNNALVNTLIKNNVLFTLKKQKYRIDAKDITSEKLILNKEQQIAYNTIKNNLNKYDTYLLKGVTGSGKTEVYMHLIDDIINQNKTALVLVPEICLTTQMIERFYHRFGRDVAIFHSGLSIGEKYDEYLKIYKGEVKIVVGTRSSLFVPLNNLGIIIIDEEHSDNYKQENTPRYDAIDIATFRCKYNNIPLLLASASPSLESMARADKKVYKLLTLENRVNDIKMPKISLVDMKEEIRRKNYLFSSILKEKMIKCIAKGEQIILLLNRRGFSTFISCKSCGYTYKCPHCDISLTYHKTTNNLRCHYCGYFRKKDDLCPSCHDKTLIYDGVGTQKLEEELLKILPSVKVIRMDQDSTSKKNSYQKIIDDFENKKYDVLLGTQMISKGLDFKNVTLVGIINADTSLNIPDFRANEKTFDLLYQTSGRSGRGEKEGEVIIQTYNPDNKVLNYVKNNNYNGFYLYEMSIRHKLKYPPYTYLVLINIKGKDYENIYKEAGIIKDYLTKNIDEKSIILGPTPSYMFKVNNTYNLQIIIKYTYDDKLKETLKNLDQNYLLNKMISIDITFNPVKF